MKGSKKKTTKKDLLLSMPSDSDESESLLTQMSQRFGGDDEESLGEEATQAT